MRNNGQHFTQHTQHTHKKKKIENRVQNRQSKIFFLAENSKVTASGITQHEKKKKKMARGVLVVVQPIRFFLASTTFGQKEEQVIDLLC